MSNPLCDMGDYEKLSIQSSCNPKFQLDTTQHVAFEV